MEELYLLVEDSELFGRQIKKKIEEELHRDVVWVKTLADTKYILSDNKYKFTAALLDYILPDSSHGEHVDLVLGKGIPTIVFTGDITGELRNNIWKKKVADYLLKDDPKCIDNIISSVLRLEKNREIIILIVDDSELFRKVISELLYSQQYRVLTAKNAVEAMPILNKYEDIKVIISDYNMPILNGVEFCRAVRKKWSRETKGFIGISSAGDGRMAADFIKSGADDFIVKQNFVNEELYHRLNKCIESIDLIQAAKKVAITDFLTGLPNRRYFFDVGEKLLASSKRDNIILTCAMIDIDFFKKVNDTYGHDVGDIVLIEIAEILKKTFRDSDIVARMGGEEFAVMTVNLNPENLTEKFEGLREEIEKTKISYDIKEPEISVTVSTGISSEKLQTVDDLLKKADELLYEAKETGRNKIVMK